MSRKRTEHEAPGKDSFLDVVANVVAILIILVMVVGSQAKQEIVQEAVAKQSAAALSQPREEVDKADSAAAQVEKSIRELEAKLQRQKIETAFRQQEREQAQMLVTVAQQALAEHRAKLDDSEKARYDLEAQLIASRGELAKLGAIEAALKNPPPTVLQHLPTPMAKTVFGTEVHFRLLGGRLAYVPWDEMLAQLKEDAQNHVHKLRDAPRVELSLPVISGFGAKYILRRTDVAVQTRVGPAAQSRVELEKIYLVDTEPDLGVPLAEALQPGSEFRSRLAGLNPQHATITVWVYPDSFEQFRELKAEAFKVGFLTAARPLPEGHPIGGSPDGTRSSAE